MKTGRDNQRGLRGEEGHTSAKTSHVHRRPVCLGGLNCTQALRSCPFKKSGELAPVCTADVPRGGLEQHER
jgi:hypothetical protein